MAESPESASLDLPWRVGVRAARANLVPGLILQAVTLALVIAYYLSPGLRDALAVVEDWKARGGFAFSAAAGAFFCGFLPWLFRMAIPGTRPPRPVVELVFGLLWWGAMLMSNDALYRFQAVLWGRENAPPVVVIKVVGDMLLYTPLWACPLNSLVHYWKARGFPLKSAGPLFPRGWYRRIVLPNLIPNWAVWIPAVAVVYSLPLMLQLPVASLIGCFWALICLSIATPGTNPDLPLVVSDPAAGKISPR